MSSEIEPFLRAVIKNLKYPSLIFNNKKTTHLSKKHQRRVTGLILTNDGDISLGRSRKREISLMIYKYIKGYLSDKELDKLQGLLGFAKGVEPIFIQRMNAKYTNEVISKIFSHRIIDNNK